MAPRLHERAVMLPHVLYLAAIVGCALFARFVRRLVRRSRRATGEPHPELTPLEVAFIEGGKWRAGEASVAGLLQADELPATDQAVRAARCAEIERAGALGERLTSLGLILPEPARLRWAFLATAPATRPSAERSSSPSSA